MIDPVVVSSLGHTLTVTTLIIILVVIAIQAESRTAMVIAMTVAAVVMF